MRRRFRAERGAVAFAVDNFVQVFSPGDGFPLQAVSKFCAQAPRMAEPCVVVLGQVIEQTLLLFIEGNDALSCKFKNIKIAG